METKPVQFKDITKKVTDLFDRNGFGEDKKIKQTFKTPAVCGGGPISVSEEIKGIDNFATGGFAGKITAKWKHACGFAIDKFENDAKKGTTIETSFDKFDIDGLAVSMKMKQQYAKGSSNTYPLEVTYQNDILATSVSTVAPSFESVTANCVLATDGLMVGSSLTLSNDGLQDYPISLSYTGPNYIAAVEASDELKCFNLLGSYKATPDFSIGSKFMVPDGSKESVSLVGVYKLNDEFKTTVAGMYSHANGFGKKGDKAKTLECAITTKPLPKVEAGCALSFPLANMGSYKYGLSFTLG